jgi:hypothetical protein
LLRSTGSKRPSGAKSAEERLAVRRKKSTPDCEALKRFLEKQLSRVSTKAPIAQANRRRRRVVDLTQEPHLARPSSFGNRNRVA